MSDSWPCNEGAVVRMLDRHRFPPPWSVEETPACFIVRDGAGQALAHLYYEESDACSPVKLLTKDEARRSAMNVTKASRVVDHTMLYGRRSYCDAIHLFGEKY